MSLRSPLMHPVLAGLDEDEWARQLTQRQLAAIDAWTGAGSGINHVLRRHGCIPEDPKWHTHTGQREQLRLICESARPLAAGSELWRGMLVPKVACWREDVMLCTSQERRVALEFSQKHYLRHHRSQARRQWHRQMLVRMVIGEGVLGVPVPPVLAVTRAGRSGLNREREVLLLPSRLRLLDTDSSCITVEVGASQWPVIDGIEVA
jgi:hypothetical protein